jgi:hypothetical protein
MNAELVGYPRFAVVSKADTEPYGLTLRARLTIATLAWTRRVLTLQSAGH